MTPYEMRCDMLDVLRAACEVCRERHSDKDSGIAIGALTFALCDMLAIAAGSRFLPLDAKEATRRMAELAAYCGKQMETTNIHLRG